MLKSHEFTVARDLYDEVVIETPEGEALDLQLIKKDLKTKWFCKDISVITSCEQQYNAKGNIRTEYCKITVDGVGEKVIRMRYKDAKELINHETYKKVGYQK
tara:strand:+ start:4105 stop:4410 length:306 start_codon:yes stop_codon:yes gene_type:complete